MTLELSATGDAWWDSLTKKQQEKYIEKHPRSKYAKKMGGGAAPEKTDGKKPASKALPKAPSKPLSPKAKGKPVDKSKKREQVRKAKERVKRAQGRVKNHQNRIITINKYIDYLDNVSIIWEDAESRISTDRYADRINRKIDSANDKKERAIDRLSKAEQSIRKAEESVQKQSRKLGELQTAAWSKREKLQDSIIITEALQKEIKETVKYLGSIKRYVSAKRKESINARLGRLRERNQRMATKKKDIRAKLKKAKD